MASVSRVSRRLPIAPISVSKPVAVTCATPWPWTTSVPEKTEGRPSPPGGCMSRIPLHGTLCTATDSPVSRASLMLRLVHESTTASAGTRSPSSRIRISSRATSRPAILFLWSSRITCALGLDRSRRASSVRSVLRS